MTKVTENGILDQREFEAYKARSVRLKFRSSLFNGLGQSTVFGIVGFTTMYFLKLLGGEAAGEVVAAGASAAGAGAAGAGAGVATGTIIAGAPAAATGLAAFWAAYWPLAVIAGIAILGIVSIYLGNKYFTESLMLDQDFNAKKIGRATSVEQAKLIEQQQVRLAALDNPRDVADEVADKGWAERLGRVAGQEQSWEQKIQQSAAQPSQGKLV